MKTKTKKKKKKITVIPQGTAKRFTTGRRQ